MVRSFWQIKVSKWVLTFGARVVICLIPCVSIAQGIPAFSKGSDYRQVRTSLIESGWLPVTQPMPPEYDNHTRGVRQMGFPEVVSCAPTGAGYCLFVFRHKQTGKKIELVTTGEGAGHPVRFSHYAI